MDPKQVEVLANVGRQLLTAKWFSISMYSLWIYDYFLTFGDEVEYAWTGRKSWVFALFIANRYLPALHIIYKGLILFDFTKSLCERTKWEVNLFTASVALLAQTTIAIRLYAVTGRSKIHAFVLCVLILGQLAIGLALSIVSGIRPLNPLPPINLDAFKICSFNQWRPGEFGFVIIAVSFDLFAFTVIYFAARGPRLRGYPGIPNLLKRILQDATKYFFLMAACQIVLLFFLFLAPPSIQPSIQLLPGITHAIFLPMMACRLMLSLRRSATESTGLWSLSCPSQAISTDMNLEFRSPAIDVLSLSLSNGEAVELAESVPELRWNGEPS